jgi:hypothetical protein
MFGAVFMNTRFSTSNGFSPKFQWNASGMNEASGNFNYYPVGSLRHTILLQGLWCWCLQSDNIAGHWVSKWCRLTSRNMPIHKPCCPPCWPNATCPHNLETMLCLNFLKARDKAMSQDLLKFSFSFDFLCYLQKERFCNFNDAFSLNK